MPSPPVAVVAPSLDRGRCTRSSCPAAPAPSRKWVGGGRAWSCSPLARLYLASTIPPTSSSAVASASPSRSSPSGSSPRTRCSRSRTGRARRRISTSAGRRGEAHPPGRAGPARAHRRRGQARRPGGVGRLDTPAAAGGRRSRLLPLRQALRHEPRAGRTAGTSSAARSSTGAWRTRRPSRTCGGSSSTRTTCCPLLRDVGHPHRRALRHRRDHPRPRVPPGHRVLRRRHRRSARPTSTTAIIDEGLLIIRRLWDAGLAHRDIKPANLLVRDGHVMLIDVAFVQVRPSPWRQAVDLANMMLVLAVRTDAETGLPAGRCCSSRPTRSPRPSPPPGAWPARPSCARSEAATAAT